MTFKRKVLLLLLPSWVSITVGAVLSLIFVSFACFMFAQHSGRLGSFTPWTYVQGADLKNSFTMLRASLNDVRLTSVFFILFWVITGFIAYNLIFALKGSVDESVGFMMELKYVNAKPISMGVHVIIRIILLAVALTLWVLFALIFSWMVLPYTLNLIDRAVTNNASPLNVGLSLLVFLGATHIGAILLRFTFLRARISRAVS